MIFGNHQSQQQQQRVINPIKSLTNAFASVSITTSPMSNSIPFPVDEIPKRYLKPKLSELDINDPATYRPRADGIHVNVILQQATLTGWLTKHRAPTFSFIKNIKRRFVVLVDRMLYTFKSEQAETYREFLELTVNTNAFVTDQFPGALFCIEIKKKGVDESWILQADDAETMKLWLDRIKRTISWLRAGHHQHCTITKDSLSEIVTEEQEYSMIAANAKKQHFFESSPNSSASSVAYPMPSSPTTYENDSIYSFSSTEYSLDSSTTTTARRHSSLRTSSRPLPNILPPQLPPPKFQLPPIPSSFV